MKGCKQLGNAGIIHAICAALLFAFLAWYALNVFTRVIVQKHHIDGDPAAPLKSPKKWRNCIYRISGYTIMICMAIMGLNLLIKFPWWNDLRATFWLESICLWAFGGSWIVKGRLFGRVLLDAEA